MYLYNSLTAQKEEIHSIEPAQFTVYRRCLESNHLYTDLANLRLIIVTDGLHRILLNEGNKVTQISNVILEEGLHQFNLITNNSLIGTTLTQKNDIVLDA